jgi:hypothetical protein
MSFKEEKLVSEFIILLLILSNIIIGTGHVPFFRKKFASQVFLLISEPNKLSHQYFIVSTIFDLALA